MTKVYPGYHDRPTRQFITSEQVASLKPGEKFSIDSGMGGSFTVAYRKTEDAIAFFDSVIKDYPFRYRIPVEAVPRRIFTYTED